MSRRKLSDKEALKRHRARLRARQRAWLAKAGNREKQNAKCRENYRRRKREMVHLRRMPVVEGLHVVQKATLKAPRLTVMGGDGRLRGEDTRSAEQVIREYRAWERAEKKRVALLKKQQRQQQQS